MTVETECVQATRSCMPLEIIWGVRIDAGNHPDCQEKAARLRNSPVGANLVVVSRWRRMRSAAGVGLAADNGRYGLRCEFIPCCGGMAKSAEPAAAASRPRRGAVALVVVTATAERSPVGQLAIALGALQRLDVRLFVDRQDDGIQGRPATNAIIQSLTARGPET